MQSVGILSQNMSLSTTSLFTDQMDMNDEEEDFFYFDPKRKRYNRLWRCSAVIIGLLLGISLIYTAYFIYTASSVRSHPHAHSAVRNAFSWMWTEQEPEEDGAPELAIYLDRFKRFMKKYERDYGGGVEVLNRFEIYLKNTNAADRLNERNAQLSARFGDTIFSDWSDDEFKELLMQKEVLNDIRRLNNDSQSKSMFQYRNASAPFQKEEVPDEFDWRKYGVVTPVKSQLKCGSCWAFATVATVETSYAINNRELRSLSEQQLLDCDLVDNACNGGHVDTALQYIYDNGLMTEYDYPYVAHRQDTCYLHGATTTIKSAVFVHPDETSIIDWLLHFGPVNVVINATADIKQYKGGVYTPDQWECENKIIGLHALNIMGYGTWNETNEKYWIIKNSWGQSYGIQQGYMYFARGINACGIEDQPMGVIA